MKVDFTQFSILPVGQLVAFRVSARARNKRPGKVAGQLQNDAMVGRPRAMLGVLLGYCEKNRTCRWVWPLSDNMSIHTMKDITYTSDMTPLPMTQEYFPPSFKRKDDTSFNRVYNTMYWIHWEKERENQLANLPDFPDLEVVNSLDDTEEVKEEDNENENEEKEDNLISDDIIIDSNEFNYDDANFQQKDSSDLHHVVSPTNAGILGSFRPILGLYTNVGNNTDAKNENDVIKIDGVKYRSAIILLTHTDLQLFKDDLLFTFGEDVWLELKGNDYWTNSDEVFDAEEYTSDEVKQTQINTTSDTEIIDYIKYKKLKEKGNDISLNIQEKNIENTTNTFITLCFYSSAPMSPKVALRQPKPLAKAAEAAIRDEKNSLIANGVLRAVKYRDIPKDKRYRILRSFTFVTNKFDSSNNWIKSKARHVIDGSDQPEDTYNWTASPVVSRPCVYLLLQQSILWNNNLMTIDVTKAFQIPDETEELYVRMEDELYQLMRSLYGCKHSAWKWFIHIRRTMIDMGFSATQYDGGTLTWVQDDEVILVLAMHVDDMLVTWDPHNEWIVKKLTNGLEEHYEITTGDGTDFLGLSIESNEDFVYVSQPGYLETLGDELDIEKSIAESYNATWDKGGPTPWTNNVLTVMQETDHEPVPIKDYQKLIGLLNYAALLRTDVQPMVNKLSSYQVAPLKNHYKILVRICWYLRSTSTEGLKLSRPSLTNGELCLWASSDASYNSKDGTSHVGHTISVGCNNGPILAISKRHPTVSTSSAEAELKGFTFCAQNVDWITNILKSVYRIKNIGTAIIEVDNEPAIKAVIGANLTKNLKHISSKYLYARLAYQERRMLFVYCKTDFLLSDALTKPLAGLKFFLFKLRLLGEYVEAHHNRELILPDKNKTKLYTGNIRQITALLTFATEKIYEMSVENVGEDEISIY